MSKQVNVSDDATLNSTVVPKLLQTIVDNQGHVMKHMQSMIDAVAALTLHVTKANTTETIPTSHCAIANPNNSLNASANVEAADSIKDGFYVLCKEPAAQVWPISFKYFKKYSDLELASCSPLSTIFTYKQQIGQSYTIFVPVIHNGQFQIKAFCVFDQASLQVMKQADCTKSTILSLENVVCYKVFEALQPCLDLDLYINTTTQPVASKHQYKEWTAFGILCFMYYIKLNAEDNQRLSWARKHEAVRFVFRLLSHIQQAIVYEHAGEAIDPVFPYQADTCHTPNLASVCNQLLQQVVLAIRDNRWIWTIICAFSFGFCYKDQLYDPIFKIDFDTINALLKHAKVEHSRDGLTMIKKTASQHVQRINLCMDAIMSYSSTKSAAKIDKQNSTNIAAMIWNQLLVLHDRFMLYRKSNQNKRPEEFATLNKGSDTAYKSLNVRFVMFCYMSHYWPSIGYLPEIDLLWPSTNGSTPNTTTAGWFHWIHIVENMNSLPSNLMKWNWFWSNCEIDCNKDQISSIMMNLIVQSQKPRVEYQYVPHKTDIWSMYQANQVEVHWSLKRLSLLANHLWNYGGIDILIPILFEEFRLVSFHTKCCILIHWLARSFESIWHDNRSDATLYNLLMKYGLSWWKKSVENMLMNAVALGHMITDVKQNKVINLSMSVYSVIDILRVFSSYNLDIAELQKHKEIWAWAWRQLTILAYNQKYECKWASVKNNSYIILRPDDHDWMNTLYKLAKDGYEPWEMLSDTDQCRITEFIGRNYLSCSVPASTNNESTTEPVVKRFKVNEQEHNVLDLYNSEEQLDHLQSELQKLSPESYKSSAPGMIVHSICKCIKEDWDVGPFFDTFDLITLEHDAGSLWISAARQNRLHQFRTLITAFESFQAAKDWARAVVPELVLKGQHEFLEAILSNKSIFYVPRQVDFVLARMMTDNPCLKLLTECKRTSYGIVVEEN